MKYDFVSIPDRAGTGSSKWDAVGGTVEHVPLSVADMEFPTPPAIKDALVNLVENRILEYIRPGKEIHSPVSQLKTYTQRVIKTILMV